MTSLSDEFGVGQVNSVGSAPIPDRFSEPTGRYVVVLADSVHGDEAAMITTLRSIAGLSTITSASDFTDSAINMQQAGDADALLLPKLGLAIVSGQPDRLASLTAAVREDPRIAAVEPERTVYPLTQPRVLGAEYLRGYRDAAAALYEHANGSGITTAVQTAAEFVDTPELTWGLQATKVATSQYDGRDVPVALLDTGLDLTHPDFAGRNITAVSFVPNERPQDDIGHGTHVTGTSSGPAQSPGKSSRYGIAFNDNIFIGKVISAQGRAADGSPLAGINWAVENRCRVISMSFGLPIPFVSRAYQTAGRRALDAGCLMIASAGNYADRALGIVGFVGAPANSPSIMAVAAVDSRLRIANFSVRGNPVESGQIDIAGPGVDVYSSSLPSQEEGRYATGWGTSFATPHVSGIAALWSQATGATGAALWARLVLTARQLPIPSLDVGAGLVQAPQ